MSVNTHLIKLEFLDEYDGGGGAINNYLINLKVLANELLLNEYAIYIHKLNFIRIDLNITFQTIGPLIDNLGC